MFLMKKVFLGGTCNGSQWRKQVIKNLKIPYYDPMGVEWTPEMIQEELKQRAESDFCLYVFTPKMEGFYSVAELIDDSNKRPGKTIFSFLYEDDGKKFSEVQLQSLKQVSEMVKLNGAKYFETLDEITSYLNNQ
jgi:hypothetical protein